MEKKKRERRDYYKEYYQKHKEEKKTKTKNYRKKHTKERKEKSKEYYQRHKDEIIIKNKEWYEKNKEYIKAKNKERYEKNKEQILVYIKNYYRSHKEEKKHNTNKRFINDVNYRLAKILRNRLWKAIKNNQKLGSAVRDLGCTVPELKIYLESKFQEGMSWENWSYTGWHIDHIKPLASFNLQNREEFLQACHYTNLQPLWAEENYTKSNKI